MDGESTDRHLQKLEDRYDRLRFLVVAGIVGTCVLALLVVVTGYRGRVDLQERLLVGCQAATIDRALQANAWDEARRARRATAVDPNTSNQEKVSAAHAADVYADTVNRLVARSDPDVLNTNLKGKQGAGLFSCDEAYPAPQFLPLGDAH